MRSGAQIPKEVAPPKNAARCSPFRVSAIMGGVLELQQTALWCACGRDRIEGNGQCSTCNRRARLSREKFAGHREEVLERDGYRAQCCGVIEGLLVHHRRPGRSARRLMISLCRRCHTRIHRTLRPRFTFPAELRPLWREVHPGQVEQLCLPLTAGFAPTIEAEQPALFEAAA